MLFCTFPGARFTLGDRFQDIQHLEVIGLGAYGEASRISGTSVSTGTRQRLVAKTITKGLPAEQLQLLTENFTYQMDVQQVLAKETVAKTYGAEFKLLSAKQAEFTVYLEDAGDTMGAAIEQLKVKGAADRLALLQQARGMELHTLLDYLSGLGERVDTVRLALDRHGSCSQDWGALQPVFEHMATLGGAAAELLSETTRRVSSGGSSSAGAVSAAHIEPILKALDLLGGDAASAADLAISQVAAGGEDCGEMLSDLFIADIARAAIRCLSNLHSLDILMTDLDPSNVAKVGSERIVDCYKHMWDRVLALPHSGCYRVLERLCLLPRKSPLVLSLNHCCS